MASEQAMGLALGPSVVDKAICRLPAAATGGKGSGKRIVDGRFPRAGQQVALWKHVDSSLLTCSRAILYVAEVVEGLDCTLCSCPTLCLFSTSFSTKAAMTCTAADES